MFVFGADVGEITYLMSASIAGERAMMTQWWQRGRWGKDCPITHGDEGEGVILISTAFFHSFGGGWRRVRIRLAVETRWIHCCCCYFVVDLLSVSAASFSKIGI